ncbi:MAG: hypothetical protein LBU39_12130 [Desulfobulbaceae bacterium]|jgi:hypothetical protein|nr:hypothetical protein [Desulfobulbaceae bacterium]
MITRRFLPLFLLVFSTLALSAFAAPAPTPLALRVFHSSNLQGEILPCG